MAYNNSTEKENRRRRIPPDFHKRPLLKIVNQASSNTHLTRIGKRKIRQRDRISTKLTLNPILRFSDYDHASNSDREPLSIEHDERGDRHGSSRLLVHTRKERERKAPIHRAHMSGPYNSNLQFFFFFLFFFSEF